MVGWGKWKKKKMKKKKKKKNSWSSGFFQKGEDEGLFINLFFQT